VSARAKPEGFEREEDERKTKVRAHAQNPKVLSMKKTNGKQK